MRLINAEELMRYTILNPNHPPYITRKDINAQPTIELERPKGEWIPCSERLPEYGKTVLWCNDRGSIFTTAITYMNGTSWAVGKRHRRCQVVAWMPLPEPYKGGQDELRS